MKIAIINGSARKGNTWTAIDAFVQGCGAAHEVDIIETDGVNVSPCKGCGACECYKGCVAKDDSNAVVDRLTSADLIVYATPVYWWGVTAQLKTIIDKSYCKAAMLKGKKIGLIVVGGAGTEDGQYDLIKTQFDCMSKFLSWDFTFFKKFSANALKDLAGNEAAVKEMKELGESL